MMNLAAPFIVSHFLNEFDKCFQFCDFIFGIESEMAELGKLNGWENDIFKIAFKFIFIAKISDDGKIINKK